jgi:hypothetical protein
MGGPLFLGPDMRPVEPLCSYFFELSRYLTAKTLADYTYDLLDMARFLAAFDPPVTSTWQGSQPDQEGTGP